MPHLSESDRLNKQYEKVGPIAVLPILTKLVDPSSPSSARPTAVDHGSDKRSIAPGFPDPLPVAGAL